MWTRVCVFCVGWKGSFLLEIFVGDCLFFLVCCSRSLDYYGRGTVAVVKAHMK